MKRFLAVLALVVSAHAAPLAAQRDRLPRLDVLVIAANALLEGPAVVSDGLLGDSKTREHLRNGFPTRLHYRLDLWRKGSLIDDRVGTAEWDVLVNYDPTTAFYNVLRRTSDDRIRENLGGFQTVTTADAQLAKPFKTSLHPNRSGRYYYDLSVDVQTLAESDLDAALQWMRGSSAPGKTSNPLASLGSGLGTLISRVISGATKTYGHVSGIFTVE